MTELMFVAAVVGVVAIVAIAFNKLPVVRWGKRGVEMRVVKPRGGK